MRILEALIPHSIDLINQFSQQEQTSSESVFVEPLPHKVAIRVDSTTTSENHSWFETLSEQTPPQSPPTDFFDDSEEDTMLYPYPRYNGEADAKADICAYLTIWQANHASKRLGVIEANISKITEFGLSLDGQAASWISQNDIAEYADFYQLREQFMQLFHRCIPQQDVISRVLRLDSAQSMSMTPLQSTLPVEEETRFRQAV